MNEILEEVKHYLDQGYKEIVLLGQNVNSYGNDGLGTNFTNLLRSIAALEGDFRIRFMSPHPAYFKDDLIELIASEKKICKSVHLPFVITSYSIHYTKLYDE